MEEKHIIGILIMGVILLAPIVYSLIIELRCKNSHKKGKISELSLNEKIIFIKGAIKFIEDCKANEYYHIGLCLIFDNILPYINFNSFSDDLKELIPELYKHRTNISGNKYEYWWNDNKERLEALNKVLTELKTK